jgi:hypothetical protein
MLILSLILLIIGTFGCAAKQVINVDGMPISNHEYRLMNDETGMVISFTLTRYYREYEGDEYLIKPEYLDALHDKNRIEAHKTERFGMHVKVVNLQKQLYSFNWYASDRKGYRTAGCIYVGKLSRKDYWLPLPSSNPGEYVYLFSIEDKDGNNLFDLPPMRYTVKGGDGKK